MGYDFTDPDEFDIVDLKFHFGRKINSDSCKFYSSTPLFGYDHIDLGITDFHFKQECFDSVDSNKYFERVKHIASKTIDELIDHASADKHFHIYSYPQGRLKSLIQMIAGSRYLKDEEIPPIGQFALYTNSNGKASRTTGIKSPRIFFLIGERAILYILFYDPFHEIKDS